MKRVLPLLLLAAALPAESHWALRAGSLLQRESPAHLVVGTPLYTQFSYAAVDLGRPAFEHETDLTESQSLRWYGGLGEGLLHLDWNVLAQAVESSLDAALAVGEAAPNRLPVLQTQPLRHGNAAAALELDQLNLRLQGSRGSLVLGRQPLNLASSFFFSPLDLFAPFRPFETYRDFRQGVDALRLTGAPSDYTLVEAIAVAAWRDPSGSEASGTDLDVDRSSLLLRTQANGGHWSATGLGGRHGILKVWGGAGQLEAWGSSWGAEGLWTASLRPQPRLPLLSDTEESTDITLSQARQWNGDLGSRLECAYHESRHGLRFADGSVGGGSGDESYRAALNLQWQATGLWNVGFTAAYSAFKAYGPYSADSRLIYDDSGTLQLTADYSLTDESVLSLSLGAPVLWNSGGLAPDLYTPYAFSLELRSTL